MSNPFVNPGGTSVGSTDASIAAAAASSQASAAQAAFVSFQTSTIASSAKSAIYLTDIITQIDVPGEAPGTKFTDVSISLNSLVVTNANIYSFYFTANGDISNYFIITDLNVTNKTYTSLYKTPSQATPDLLGTNELRQIIIDFIPNPVTSSPFTNVTIIPSKGFFFNDDNTYTFYFYGDDIYSYYFKIENFDASILTYSSLNTTGDITTASFSNVNITPFYKFSFASFTNSHQYILALMNNTIQYSSNFGATWSISNLPNTITWIDMDVSDDGKYATVVAFTGEVYISSNYGATWIKSNYPKGIHWKSVNVNDSGELQYIASDDTFMNAVMYRSEDYGQTWFQTILQAVGKFKDINISSDGQIMVIINDSNQIWISVDYGSYFTYDFSVPGYDWVASSISANNKYLSVVSTDGYIYSFARIISYYFVPTEATLPVSGLYFTGITMEQTGRFQYAITQSGEVYYSKNYGVDWESTTLYNLNVTGNTGSSYIQCSLNGEYQVIGAQYGNKPGIYVSNSSGAVPYPAPLTPVIIGQYPGEEDMKNFNYAMRQIYTDRYFVYDYNSFTSYNYDDNNCSINYDVNNIFDDSFNIFKISLYVNPNYSGYTGTSPGITGNYDTRFKYLVSYEEIYHYYYFYPITSIQYDYISGQQADEIKHVLKTHVLFTSASIILYTTNVTWNFYDYINDTYDVRFGTSDSNVIYLIYGLNLNNYSYTSITFIKTSINVNVPLNEQFDLLYQQLLNTQPTYEILEFSKDNYNPMNYSGNLIGSMEGILYDIELLSVMVPNKPLKNAYNIGAFPYFYVIFHPQSLKNKNLLYSNNNSSSYAAFIVRSITADTNTNFSYLTLSSTKQRIKFKPNEDLIFSLYQPNGKLVEFQQSDYFSPYPPIDDFQISAVFNITKALDDKSSKDTYSKMIEINSLRRNRNAYPNPASFTALFNQNANLNTNALNALDPVYLSIPQYVFRTNSNRVTNTIRRVNSVSSSDTSQIFLDKSESSVNSYLVGYNILLFYYGNGNINSTPTYIYDRMIYGYNGVTQCATINRSLPYVSGSTGQQAYGKNTLTYILYDKTFSSNYGFINKYGVTGCTGATGVPAGPTGITGSTGTILPIDPNESIIPFTNFKTQITTTLPSANSRSVIIIDYPVPDPVAYPTKYYYPPAGFFDFCYITINIDGLDPGTPCQNNILTNTRKIINTEVDFSTTATPTTLVLYLEQELNYIPQPGSICIINNVLDNLNLYPSVSTQFTDIYGTNNVRTESGYDNFYVDFLLENTLSKEFQVIKSYKNVINLAETKMPYSYTNVSDNMSDINSYLNYDVVYTIRQQRPLDYMYVFPTQTLPTIYGIYDITSLPPGFSCDPPVSVVNYINAGSPNGLNYLVLDSRSFLEPRFYDNLYIRFTKNLDSNYDLTCRIVKYYPYMNIYDKNYDPPKLVYRQPIYVIEFDNYATATQQLQSNPGKILTITISSVSSVFKING